MPLHAKTQLIINKICDRDFDDGNCLKLAKTTDIGAFFNNNFFPGVFSQRRRTGSLNNYIRQSSTEDLKALQIAASFEWMKRKIDSDVVDNLDNLKKIAQAADEDSLYRVLSGIPGYEDLSIGNKPLGGSFLTDVKQRAQARVDALVATQVRELKGSLTADDNTFFAQLATSSEVKTDADLDKKIRDKLGDRANEKSKESIDKVVAEKKSDLLRTFEANLKARAALWKADVPRTVDTIVSGRLADAKVALTSAQARLEAYKASEAYIKAKNRKDYLYNKTGNFLAQVPDYFRPGLGGHFTQAADKVVLDQFDALKTLRDSAERDLAFLTTQSTALEWQKIVAKQVDAQVNPVVTPTVTIDYKILRREHETLNRADDVTQIALWATAAKLIRNAAIYAAAAGSDEGQIPDAMKEEIMVQVGLSEPDFNVVVQTVMKVNQVEIGAATLSIDPGERTNSQKISGRAAAELVVLTDIQTVERAGRIAALKAATLDAAGVLAAVVAAGVSDDPAGGGLARQVVAETVEARAAIREAIRADLPDGLGDAADDEEALEAAVDGQATARDKAIQKYIHLQDTAAAVLIRATAKAGFIRDSGAEFKTSIVHGVVDLDAEAQRIVGAIKGLGEVNDIAGVNTGINVDGLVFERAPLKTALDYKFTSGHLERGALCLAEDTNGTIHGLSSIEPLGDHPSEANAGQYQRDVEKEAYIHAMKRFESYKPGDEITIFCKGRHDAKAAMRLHAAMLVVADDLGIKNLKIIQRVGGCSGPEKTMFSDGTDKFIRTHLRDSFDNDRATFKEQMKLLKENNTIHADGTEGDIIHLKRPER